MKNIRVFIFILVILLTLGLVSCTRSASQPSDAPKGEESVSGDATSPVIDVLEEKGTQTAIAEEAGAEPMATEPPAEGAGAEESTGEGEPAAEESAPEEAPPTETTVEETEESGGESDSEQGGGQEPVTVPEEYEVPNKYTLQAGEFPWCIARRFNIDVSALLNANGLNTNSNVYPGTTLTIPKDAGPYAGARALRAHPTDYTVQHNDTVNSIACYFGDVDPRAIEAVNGLTGSYTLTPGDVIKIP
jgi:LysM repeat protein